MRVTLFKKLASGLDILSQVYGIMSTGASSNFEIAYLKMVLGFGEIDEP